MALESSGAMSLGGATTGRSVNLELGCSATAQIGMNDTAARTLAGVASGAISMSDFYGKSSGPGFSIGDYVVSEGGYYTGTSCGYYLFASTVTLSGCKWKTTHSATPGTTTCDGYSNTYNNKNATHPLFNSVGNLTTGGFSDWYVGALCEVQQQYDNCAAVGGYCSSNYWSSTDYSCYIFAYGKSFSNGCTYYYFKDDLGVCSRPLRRCAI